MLFQNQMEVWESGEDYCSDSDDSYGARMTCRLVQRYTDTRELWKCLLDFFKQHPPEATMQPAELQKLCHSIFQFIRIPCTTLVVEGEILEVESDLLQKIPYFEVALSGRVPMTTDHEGRYIVGCIESGVLRAILHYVSSSMVSDLLDYLPTIYSTETLKSALDFMLIDIGESPSDVILDQRLKDTKYIEEHIRVCRRTYETNVLRYPNPEGACDAATIICLNFSSIDFKQPRLKSKVFEQVLYILSHPKTFSKRLRCHVWNTVTEQRVFSHKQMQQLDRWKPNQPNDKKLTKYWREYTV